MIYPLNVAEHIVSKENTLITSLPHDAISYILSYLDFRSLINFEYFLKFSDELKNLKTNHIWTILKVKDNLNLSWAMCQKESNPPKWEYRLSHALSQYIFVHKYHEIVSPDENALSIRIDLQYFDLINKFPILNKYFAFDSRCFSDVEDELIITENFT